nr:MAG TPA: hypothetical protein [Caudoviricetes sp.]
MALAREYGGTALPKMGNSRMTIIENMHAGLSWVLFLCNGLGE